MDPLTKVLYHNYTLTASKRLYPNVKLEDSSFQQYEESLKKLICEIYQWSMNTNLNVSDENLHCSLFAKADLKQSQFSNNSP